MSAIDQKSGEKEEAERALTLQHYTGEAGMENWIGRHLLFVKSYEVAPLASSIAK